MIIPSQIKLASNLKAKTVFTTQAWLEGQGRHSRRSTSRKQLTPLF